MVQAKQGDTVRVHYTGRLDDGSVFDSSEGRTPLEFTIGQRRLIPGFEQGVLGMEPGEMKTINIPAEQAYGPRQADMVMDVERSQMPAGLELEVGLRLQGAQSGGRTVEFRVISFTLETVKLDGNHPLAGKELIFDVQLVEII